MLQKNNSNSTDQLSNQTKTEKQSGKQNRQSTNDGTILFHLSENPSILNPILSTDMLSSQVEGLVFNGLFKINEKLELEPDLLESYSVTNNNKTYEFKLKSNITWHDGMPFTSHDVKFTFDKILDPNTNTVRRSSFMVDGKVVSIKVIDDRRFNIHLPKPYAPFLTRISMPIIPKHIYEGKDINTHPANHAPIGTGPFKFDRWETGQFIRLIRHEAYFNQKPKLAAVLFKIIPDSNTALIALEKQEIDEGSIQSKDIKKVQSFPHVDVHIFDKLGYSYMGFNLKKEPFNNKLFRQAISHAINRDALVKSILKGYGRPVYIPSTPVSWAFPDQPYVADYNPSKAKKLLASIGYTWNKKEKRYYNGDNPLSFTLITSKGSESAEKTAQIIQQYLKAIGVTMTINLMEWSSMQTLLDSKEEPRPFDATLQGWSLGIDPDSYSIWHSSQYPDGFNFIGYSNPDVDTLLEQGRQELNQEKRKIIYSECFNLIGEDTPYIFLFSPQAKTGINTRVHGLSTPGPAGLFNDIEEVWVTE